MESVWIALEALGLHPQARQDVDALTHRRDGPREGDVRHVVNASRDDFVLASSLHHTGHSSAPCGVHEMG